MQNHFSREINRPMKVGETEKQNFNTAPKNSQLNRVVDKQ